jgi:hypothetical protein
MRFFLEKKWRGKKKRMHVNFMPLTSKQSLLYVLVLTPFTVEWASSLFSNSNLKVTGIWMVGTRRGRSFVKITKRSIFNFNIVIHTTSCCAWVLEYQ